MSELIVEIDEMNCVNNQVIRTNRIKQILNVYNELVKTKKVILVLDIDDVVISSSCYRIFTEKDICQLVSQAYYLNKSNLVFLTSRLKEMRKYTLDQFNEGRLIDSDEYIYYNIIFAELDQQGNSTKGPVLSRYIKQNYSLDSNSWVIFVDDLVENINSVKNSLEDLNANFTLFHYKNR